MLSAAGDQVPVYRLGVEALQIGLSYLSQTSLDSAARPVLSRLSRQTGETVFLSVRSGASDLVYVMKYLSDSEYQTVCSIGTVRPLLSVAMGKAMLSVLSDAQVAEEVTPEMLEECSIGTLRTVDALLTWLQKIRQDGYVTEDTSENPHYATTVAAPLRDVDGQLAGAISVVVMQDPRKPERIRTMGEMVKAAALEISRGLGYLGEKLYQ